MRLLFTIPHYFGDSRRLSAGSLRHRSQQSHSTPRLAALSRCIHALHQLYGTDQCMMQLAQRRTSPANTSSASQVHVVVCTSGSRHLLQQLSVDSSLYQHYPADIEPLMLGFQCQAVLRDRWGNYDYYCYLEDDLILHDPWLFIKLAWFNGHVGSDKLLLPNRFERGPGPLAHKAYVDGDLPPRATEAFQNIHDDPRLESNVMGTPLVFRRPLNPHAGCYFLNANQLQHWTSQSFFLDRSTAFIGPLESAATLGIMRAFKIYKPASENANFLEIEHYGRQFLDQLRKPT